MTNCPRRWDEMFCQVGNGSKNSLKIIGLSLSRLLTDISLSVHLQDPHVVLILRIQFFLVPIPTSALNSSSLLLAIHSSGDHAAQSPSKMVDLGHFLGSGMEDIIIDEHSQVGEADMERPVCLTVASAVGPYRMEQQVRVTSRMHTAHEWCILVRRCCVIESSASVI